MNIGVVRSSSRGLHRGFYVIPRALLVPIRYPLFLLMGLVSVALFGASKVNAQANPPGTFIEVQAVLNDESRVCSFFKHKKKTTAYLRRIDGLKIQGKRFWDIKKLKKEVSTRSKTVQALKKIKTPSGKKKFKKEKVKLATFKAAKSQLQECLKKGTAHSASVPVTFAHVQGLIDQQCMSCHGVLGWQNTQEFFRDSGRVVPGDLEASPFYTFLSNNPEGYQPGYMPKGLPPLSDQNLLLLGRWILSIEQPLSPTATPTPGGAMGEGRNLYNANCSGCHGLIDVSSKWGRTEAQILAAMNSVPQMLFLKNQLTTEQIQKIALALSVVQPPEEGTVSVTNLGSVIEGNSGGAQVYMQFEVRLTGAASQPFTVGFVTTNGGALADSDFEFLAGTLQFQGVDQEVHIINVPIFSDDFPELDESLYVDIGGVSYGGVRVGTSTASGIIINDDGAGSNPPPLASQVRAAYAFNGNYHDAVGIADAQPEGTVSFTSQMDARIGSAAVRFDDATDHVIVPGDNFKEMSDFSFAAWVYWENSSSTTSRIFDFGASETNYIYFVPNDSTNRCRFEIRGDGFGPYILQCNPGVTLPDNQWVHLAVTFNSATDQMYIFFDGQQVAARNFVGLPMSLMRLTDNKIATSRVAGQTEFVGRIDEVIVWDAALDQSQVAEVMNMTGSASFSSGLEVLLDGAPVPNGSLLDFGSAETGSVLSKTLLVVNNGLGGLELLSDPKVELGGADADSFIIKVQPMPWQQLIGLNSVASFLVRYTPTLAGTKNATLLLDNSDPLHGNFALALRGTATGDPVIPPGGGGGGGGDPVLAEGQQLYAINCASCHGVLAHSSKLGRSAQQIMDALNQVPQMQTLELTSDQVQKIALALNSPPPPTEAQDYVRTAVVNVGTAPYVVSMLTDIFLPPDPSMYTGADITIAQIISQGVFGLNLDGSLHAAGRVMFFSRRRQRFDTSFQVEELNNLQRPVPDTVRAGLLRRVCDLITQEDRAVNNALGKIGYTSTQELSAQAVKDIYEKLFAPGKTLPIYMAENIYTFPNGAPGYSNIDKWRFVLNLFCLSGEGEKL